MPAINALQRLVSSSLLIAAAFSGGCATTAPRQTHAQSATPESATEASTSELIPVVRYGRYTLVELAPTAAQRDLLLQVVDVAVPDTLHASVGDALWHVLLRSGYRMCDGHDADALLTLPLPVAHYRLGPVVLRDALLTLAGPAWDLQVDDGTRRVCFTQAVPDVPEQPQPTTLPDTDDRIDSFPLAGEARP